MPETGHYGLPDVGGIITALDEAVRSGLSFEDLFSQAERQRTLEQSFLTGYVEEFLSVPNAAVTYLDDSGQVQHFIRELESWKRELPPNPSWLSEVAKLITLQSLADRAYDDCQLSQQNFERDITGLLRREVVLKIARIAIYFEKEFDVG